MKPTYLERRREGLRQQLEAVGVNITQRESGAYRLQKRGIDLLVCDLADLDAEDLRKMGVLREQLPGRWKGKK